LFNPPKSNVGDYIKIYMSEHSQYLTDGPTTEHIYSLLLADRLDDAIGYIKGLGDAQSVTRSWIGLQCDINNVKGDPYLSEKLARPGVEYALENGLKTGAAILLHNIFAFHTQNWDETVDPKVIPVILSASRQQVNLRRELTDQGGFGWALWDLGMSEMIAGNFKEALAAFKEADAVHLRNNDPDGAAWSRLFRGKALIRFDQEQLEEGRKIMLASAASIREIGEDWEKEEVGKILKTVGLK